MAKRFNWLGYEYFNETAEVVSIDPTLPVRVNETIELSWTPETSPEEEAVAVVEGALVELEQDLVDTATRVQIAKESLANGGLSVVAAELYMSQLNKVTDKYGLERTKLECGLEAFGFGMAGKATKMVISAGIKVVKTLLELTIKAFHELSKVIRLRHIKWKADTKSVSADIDQLRKILRERSVVDMLPDIRMDADIAGLCVNGIFDLDRAIEYAHTPKRLREASDELSIIVTGMVDGNKLYSPDVTDELDGMLRPISDELSAKNIFKTSIFKSNVAYAYALPGNITIGVTKDSDGYRYTKYAETKLSDLPKTVSPVQNIETLQATVEAAAMLADRIDVKLDNFNLTSDVIGSATTMLTQLDKELSDSLVSTEDTEGTPTPDDLIRKIKIAKHNIESAWDVEAGISYSLVNTLHGLVSYANSNLKYMH